MTDQPKYVPDPALVAEWTARTERINNYLDALEAHAADPSIPAPELWEPKPGTIEWYELVEERSDRSAEKMRARRKTNGLERKPSLALATNPKPTPQGDSDEINC